MNEEFKGLKMDARGNAPLNKRLNVVIDEVVRLRESGESKLTLLEEVYGEFIGHFLMLHIRMLHMLNIDERIENGSTFKKGGGGMGPDVDEFYKKYKKYQDKVEFLENSKEYGSQLKNIKRILENKLQK